MGFNSAFKGLDLNTRRILNVQGVSVRSKCPFQRVGNRVPDLLKISVPY